MNNSLAILHTVRFNEKQYKSYRESLVNVGLLNYDRNSKTSLIKIC